MPPAFVLSQDQTLKFVSRYNGTSLSPPTNAPNFREPIPALVKRNGYEGHIRHRLINRLPEPKDPRTGRRRPHVPSSKTNNVKEPPKQTAGQPSFPGFYLGGLVARLCRRPVKCHSVAASPSGEAAYMDHSRVGQTLFSKNFHIPNHHTPKPQFPAIPTGYTTQRLASIRYEAAQMLRHARSPKRHRDRFASLSSKVYPEPAKRSDIWRTRQSPWR